MTKETFPIVEWEKMADYDFVFVQEQYTLRVERMNQKSWWWCVYYDDVELRRNKFSTNTELEAKLLAELCFLRHLNGERK